MNEAASRVVGHGIDLVNIDRFRVLLDARLNSQLERMFCESELSAAGSSQIAVERLASRFAVKEAVLKSMGLGWGGGVSFRDVEVITCTSGNLDVVVYRTVASRARDMNIKKWFVSTSHDGGAVIASVIAVSY